MNSINKDLIPIGKVIKPHGLKGEVKVFLYNKESNTLQIEISIWLKMKDEFKPYLIEGIRGINKNIIKFKNLNNRNSCNYFVNKRIFVKRKDFPKISSDEFYLNDLIGFNVYDSKKMPYGILSDVLIISKEEILVINYLEKEILIPNNKNFIKLFDFKKKIIIIDKIEQFILWKINLL